MNCSEKNSELFREELFISVTHIRSFQERPDGKFAACHAPDGAHRPRPPARTR